MPFAGVWLITGDDEPGNAGISLMMKIRVGYEVIHDSPQPTPMLLMLRVHPSRAADLVTPDPIVSIPPIPIGEYHDSFGNLCGRILAPAGRLTLSAEAIVRDTGQPDSVAPSAGQCAIADLPSDTLMFLLGSRYCETDVLSDTAWSLFGNTPPRLGAGAGDLRFCPRSRQLRLRARQRDQDGARRLRAAPRACAATSPIWRSPFAAA